MPVLVCRDILHRNSYASTILFCDSRPCLLSLSKFGNLFLEALQLDLIGPSGATSDHREILPQAPSRWFLTGFLVPTDADKKQRFDPNSNHWVDQAPAIAGIDENEAPASATTSDS